MIKGKDRPNAKPIPATDRDDDDLDDEPREIRYPTLRSAIWLYLIITAATLGIISFSDNIEISFLRLLTAILIIPLVIFAVILTRSQIGPLFGSAPKLIDVIICLLIGVAMWLVISWLTSVINAFLSTAIGSIAPPKVIATGATRTAAILQTGIIIPVCEGVLFWAFLQRTAESVGRLGGVIITALLFGLFARYSTDFGIDGLLGYLLMGLVIALVVDFTNSAWCGIAVAVGYNLILPIIQNTRQELDLFAFLFPRDVAPGDALFEGRWLLAIAFSAFLVFILVQVIRARHSDPTGNVNRDIPVKTGRLWWIPLVLSLMLYAYIGYGEIITRALNPPSFAPPPSNDATTIVPQPPTLRPTAAPGK